MVSFLAFNYYGFKVQGPAYLKHFMGPILWLAPLMIVLELVGTLVRPVSLGLRLFGNLFGDHLVLEIFTGLTKVGCAGGLLHAGHLGLGDSRPSCSPF